MTYAQNLWIFAVLVFGIIIVPGMAMFFGSGKGAGLFDRVCGR